MAGYYDRDAVDDFDDYDPEPYSGGYDQLVAYGKPIPPTEDTCFTPSVPKREEHESNEYAFGSESCPYGDRIDLERPLHGSGSEPSQGRPKPQPAHDFDQPQPYKSDEFGQRTNKPSYGEEDPYNKPQRPGYGHDEEEGWKKSSYEGEEDPYKKPQRPSYGHEEGEGEGWKKPSYGEEAEEPPRFERPDYNEGGDDTYEKKSQRPSYGQDEGEGWKKPSYGEEDSYKKPQRPSYGQDEGEGWKKPSYDEEDSYKKPQRAGYGEDEGEGWKKPSYGEEAEEPPRFERPDYNEGGEDRYKKRPQRLSCGEEEGEEWRKPSYGGEGVAWKKSSYGEEGEDPYKKPQRPSYRQDAEETFGTPTYRPDEGAERPEYGDGEEYEERRYERPSSHHCRDSYTDE